MEPVSTTAADINDDEHWAATFFCNYLRSFRRKAKPPQVRTSAFAARVARRGSREDFHHHVDVQLGAQTKAPRHRGAPKLHPVRPSGGELSRLDLQDFAGTRDRDRPRLHRLWDLAHEVDVQESVF
jgi:hypothetical protein